MSANGFEPIDLDALADAIARRLSPPPSPLLTADQAGELLNVPATWLLAEAKAKRVPHVRFGKYVRFDRDELAAWVDGRTVGPKPTTSRARARDLLHPSRDGWAGQDRRGG